MGLRYPWDDEETNYNPLQGTEPMGPQPLSDPLSAPVQPVQPALPPATPVSGQQLVQSQGVQPDRQAAINQYITAKRQGDEGFAAAQDKAASDTRTANIMQGVGDLFSAKGQSYGARPQDPGVYNAIRQSAAQGLQNDAVDKRQAVQDYLTEKQLGRQDTQDLVAAQGAQRDQALFDEKHKGGTPASMAYANMAKKLFPQLKAITAQTASIAEVEAALKPIEYKESVDAKRLVAADLNARRSDRDTSQRYEKENIIAQQSNPASPGRASRVLGDFYRQLARVNKANGILFEKNNGNPVFNSKGELEVENLPMVKVHEYIAAWVSAVNNGQAMHEGQRESVTPENINSKIAELVTKYNSAPSPANQQAFLRSLADSMLVEDKITRNMAAESVVGIHNNLQTLKTKNPDLWALYVKNNIKPFDPDFQIDRDIDEKGSYIPKESITNSKKRGGGNGISSNINSGAVRSEKQMHNGTSYIYEFDKDGTVINAYPEGGSGGAPAASAQNTPKKKEDPRFPDRWWEEK